MSANQAHNVQYGHFTTVAAFTTSSSYTNFTSPPHHPVFARFCILHIDDWYCKIRCWFTTPPQHIGIWMDLYLCTCFTTTSSPLRIARQRNFKHGDRIFDIRVCSFSDESRFQRSFFHTTSPLLPTQSLRTVLLCSLVSTPTTPLSILTLPRLLYNPFVHSHLVCYFVVLSFPFFTPLYKTPNHLWRRSDVWFLDLLEYPLLAPNLYHFSHSHRFYAPQPPMLLPSHRFWILGSHSRSPMSWVLHGSVPFWKFFFICLTLRQTWLFISRY